MAGYEGTQAIARAFALLNMFDDTHPAWSLADLAAATKFKKDTAFRILSALEYEGIWQRTSGGDFQLGSALIVLEGRAVRANRLRAVVHLYLTELVRQTRESATLDVLLLEKDAPPVLIVIDELLGPHQLGMSQYIGAHIPAHATAPGKVLLAYQPRDLLRDALPEALSAETEYTITSRDQLMDALAEIPELGFATTMHELELGIMATGAPIFDHHGEVKAAISIGGPSSRITPERLIDYGHMTVEVANAISHQLGFR